MIETERWFLADGDAGVSPMNAARERLEGEFGDLLKNLILLRESYYQSTLEPYSNLSCNRYAVSTSI